MGAGERSATRSDSPSDDGSLSGSSSSSPRTFSERPSRPHGTRSASLPRSPCSGQRSTSSSKKRSSPSPAVRRSFPPHEIDHAHQPVGAGQQPLGRKRRAQDVLE